MFPIFVTIFLLNYCRFFSIFHYSSRIFPLMACNLSSSTISLHLLCFLTLLQTHYLPPHCFSVPPLISDTCFHLSISLYTPPPPIPRQVLSSFPFLPLQAVTCIVTYVHLSINGMACGEGTPGGGELKGGYQYALSY